MIVTVLHVNFWFGHFSGEVSFQFVIYIGGSRIFLEGVTVGTRASKASEH